MMDLSVIMPWVLAAITIFNFLGLLKGWLSSGEKALAEEVAEVKKTLGDDVATAKKTLVEHDRRIQTIEGEIKHLPDRDTTHRMELAMAEISGNLNVMAERLKPIEAIGERLQNTLLNRADSK